MNAVCIVWQCPRPAVGPDGQCLRHCAIGPVVLSDPERESVESDVAYALAEGLTLAEVAALTA